MQQELNKADFTKFVEYTKEREFLLIAEQEAIKGRLAYLVNAGVVPSKRTKYNIEIAQLNHRLFFIKKELESEKLFIAEGEKRIEIEKANVEGLLKESMTNYKNLEKQAKKLIQNRNMPQILKDKLTQKINRRSLGFKDDTERVEEYVQFKNLISESEEAIRSVCFE